MRLRSLFQTSQSTASTDTQDAIKTETIATIPPFLVAKYPELSRLPEIIRYKQAWAKSDYEGDNSIGVFFTEVVTLLADIYSKATNYRENTENLSVYFSTVIMIRGWHSQHSGYSENIQKQLKSPVAFDGFRQKAGDLMVLLKEFQGELNTPLVTNDAEAAFAYLYTYLFHAIDLIGIYQITKELNLKNISFLQRAQLAAIDAYLKGKENPFQTKASYFQRMVEQTTRNVDHYLQERPTTPAPAARSVAATPAPTATYTPTAAPCRIDTPINAGTQPGSAINEEPNPPISRQAFHQSRLRRFRPDPIDPNAAPHRKQPSAPGHSLSADSFDSECSEPNIAQDSCTSPSIGDFFERHAEEHIDLITVQARARPQPIYAPDPSLLRRIERARTQVNQAQYTAGEMLSPLSFATPATHTATHNSLRSPVAETPTNAAAASLSTASADSLATPIAANPSHQINPAIDLNQLNSYKKIQTHKQNLENPYCLQSFFFNQGINQNKVEAIASLMNTFKDWIGRQTPLRESLSETLLQQFLTAQQSTEGFKLINQHRYRYSCLPTSWRGKTRSMLLLEEYMKDSLKKYIRSGVDTSVSMSAG